LFGLLDIEKYLSLVTSLNKENFTTSISKNKLEINLNNTTSNNILFLPLIYNSGLHCVVNGKEVKPVKILNNFMGISVASGNNNINITFFPNGLVTGFKISTITFIFLLLLYFINKKFNILLIWNMNTNFKLVIVRTFLVIYLVAIICIYIIPIGFAIYSDMKISFEVKSNLDDLVN
jgi:hypothetical protein